MAPPAAALVATVVSAVALFHGCSPSRHITVTSCIEARIGGKLVCLAPGKRCAARHERIYRSYALTCRNGVLRERNYIGPANP